MHGYMKYTQPLFIQGIMPIKSLYDSKVRRAHFGFPPNPLIRADLFRSLSWLHAFAFPPRASTPAVHQQILKIHLLGQPATGELKRPFEAPAGLMDAATKAANAVDEKKPATAIAPAKDEKKKDK